MTKAKKPSKKSPAKKAKGELSEKDTDRVTGGGSGSPAPHIKGPVTF
jgi:hypothetical protein